MKVQNLESADIDILNELQPSGWEDIRTYFYYYISSPSCDSIKICDGKRIAAVGTTIRHTDTAWLAHVIVHPNFRNQGLGKKLTSELVDRAYTKNIHTIYLDATDMGFPVYQKLGFETETEYIHLEGDLMNINLNNPAAVIPYDEKYHHDILKLDQISSGEHREQILSERFNDSLIYLREGKAIGIYLPNFFEHGIMAKDPEAGTELMKLRMRVKSKFRFPIGNKPGVDFLIKNGYQQIRTSKKMILGPKRKWKAENNFNRISGGLG